MNIFTEALPTCLCGVSARRSGALCATSSQRGNHLASSLNLRSGLQAVGALRPAESNSQQPVALETAVVATGARPGGDSTAKRELFTEETQTVLVFENGAVIRLSAAVADGQLLFLTNKSTGKEVVTQVLRKRSFRPTNCYVDLEFTEPCPNFWGIEFPKAAVPAVPATTSNTRTDTDESPITLAKPATPPSLQEVERLKQEVSQLQTQLKSFAESAPAEGAAAAGPLAAGPAAAKVAGKIGALVARREEEEKQLEELFALEAKQEAAHSPKRLVAYPKKSGTRVSQKIASKKWQLAAALAAVLCLTLAYDFGAFGSSPIKPAAPKSAKTVPTASGPVALKPIAMQTGLTASHDLPKTPAAMAPIATNIPAAKSSPVIVTENKSEKALSSSSANPGKEIPSAAIPKAAAPASHFNSRRTADKPSETAQTKGGVANNSIPSSSASLNMNATTAASASDGGTFTLPRLLHAVKPVAPPEALKNYVTGTVNVDALVDATGHIKSVTVLSGPTKLRQHAIEEMKQYVYEPAKRNGIAVNSHVQVSLQYWYEP